MVECHSVNSKDLSGKILIPSPAGLIIHLHNAKYNEKIISLGHWLVITKRPLFCHCKRVTVLTLQKKNCSAIAKEQLFYHCKMVSILPLQKDHCSVIAK